MGCFKNIFEENADKHANPVSLIIISGLVYIYMLVRLKLLKPDWFESLQIRNRISCDKFFLIIIYAFRYDRVTLMELFRPYVLDEQYYTDQDQAE